MYIKTLYDTGPRLNFLSKQGLSLFNNVDIKQCNTPILTVTDEHFTQKIEIPFKFNSCQAEFFIVPGKLVDKFDAVLGMLFLYQHSAIIDYINKTISLNINKRTH